MKSSALFTLRPLTISAAIASFLICIVQLPSSAVVYEGLPDLGLLATTVDAGGGPSHFSSLKLLTFLAGPNAAAETAKLTTQFGNREVQNALAVFDFAVADALRVANVKNIVLPRPVREKPRALSLALFMAGRTPSGHWDVGYMLEQTMSHPIHRAIMVDMNAKFGSANNGRFHVVLAQLMDDLAVLSAQSTN